MKVFCKYCGYENDDNASICENCGAELNSIHSEDASMSTGKRNKILLVAVAVIILGVVIAALITLNYSQPDKADPRAINLVCPYCGAGPNTLVAVRENMTHIKWYCQYCDYTWWEPIS